jgi:hypothetical protein
MDRTETSPPPTRRDEAFWYGLIESETLDRRLVDEYLRVHAELGPKPLGAILVQAGFLTVRQVATLLGMQADEPYVRIGELAVREGYCALEDVEAALALQLQAGADADGARPSASATPEEVHRALVDYVHFLEQRVSER